MTRWACKQRWLYIEILVTSVILAVIWALLSLPTVFYFLPQQVQKKQSDEKGCVNYSKSTCFQALSEISVCLPGTQHNASSVKIAANVDQETNDETAQLIISGLPLLGASEMCKSSLIPFMCLYLFPLCDGKGMAHKPSIDQCIEISTVLCKDEWQKAQSISTVKNQLPDCQRLSISTSCLGMHAQALDEKNNTIINNMPELSEANQINCTEPFYFSNGTCLPLCDKWKQYSNEKSAAIDVITILSALSGFTFGSITLVVSCIGRRKMFAFPAVILVYMTITVVTFSVLILISFMNRKKLFCSSENLIQAIQNPTPYCSFIGSVYYYSLLQLSVWWLCHVTTVFWKIRFPFQAKMMENGTKSIHLAVILLGLVIPFIPIIVGFATGGFIVDHFPPVICVTTSGDAAYYTLALPVSFIIAIGTSLLILVLVTIVKHTRAVKRRSAKEGFVGTAEMKIFIVFCYYVLIGSAALAAFTLNATTSASFVKKINQYFACKANGDSDMCDDERSAYERFTYPEIGTASFILLGFLPAVNLVYVLSCDNLKRICIFCNKWIRKQPLTSTSATK